MKSLALSVLALLPLCSCSVESQTVESDTTSEFAEALERYGNLEGQSSDLSSVLTGSALAAAIDSRQLLDSLGYRRLGTPTFEVVSRSKLEAIACMDLSQVVVVDEAGLPVSLPLERETVAIELDGALISRFELKGQRC